MLRRSSGRSTAPRHPTLQPVRSSAKLALNCRSTNALPAYRAARLTYGCLHVHRLLRRMLDAAPGQLLGFINGTLASGEVRPRFCRLSTRAPKPSAMHRFWHHWVGTELRAFHLSGAAGRDNVKARSRWNDPVHPLRCHNPRNATAWCCTANARGVYCTCPR